MRIIGGTLRGRKLQAFEGKAIRPTPDRVREALFNILAHNTRDADVLDLFAGTGALGIEAISRGARSALFVDQSAAALKVLKQNLQRCQLSADTRTVQRDIAQSLDGIAAPGQVFNLVFMDPPYGCNLPLRAVENLLRAGCLANHARIVVEHEPAFAWPPLETSLRCIDSRRYGQTQITFFDYTQ